MDLWWYQYSEAVSEIKEAMIHSVRIRTYFPEEWNFKADLEKWIAVCRGFAEKLQTLKTIMQIHVCLKKKTKSQFSGIVLTNLLETELSCRPWISCHHISVNSVLKIRFLWVEMLFTTIKGVGHSPVEERGTIQTPHVQTNPKSNNHKQKCVTVTLGIYN